MEFKRSNMGVGGRLVFMFWGVMDAVYIFGLLMMLISILNGFEFTSMYREMIGAHRSVDFFSGNLDRVVEFFILPLFGMSIILSATLLFRGHPNVLCLAAFQIPFRIYCCIPSLSFFWPACMSGAHKEWVSIFFALWLELVKLSSLFLAGISRASKRGEDL